MMSPQECRVAWGRGRKFINNLRSVLLSMFQCTDALCPNTTSSVIHCNNCKFQCAALKIHKNVTIALLNCVQTRLQCNALGYSL